MLNKNKTIKRHPKFQGEVEDDEARSASSDFDKVGKHSVKLAPTLFFWEKKSVVATECKSSEALSENLHGGGGRV